MDEQAQSDENRLKLKIHKKKEKSKVCAGFAGVVPKEKRFAHGEFMRSKFPLQLYAKAVPEVRPDPCIAFGEGSRHRISRLIPLRHQHILESPFTFFRGSAGLNQMAIPEVDGIEGLPPALALQ